MPKRWNGYADETSPPEYPDPPECEACGQLHWPQSNPYPGGDKCPLFAEEECE